MKKLFILGLGLLLLAGSAFGFTIKEGRHYQVYENAKFPTVVGQPTLVLEFFNYGCGACYGLEPILKEWAAAQGDTILFKKIPVAFHKGWLLLARAYYVADVMDEKEKVNAALFKTIHDDNKSLTTSEQLAVIFSQFGIDKKEFENAFQFSPLLDIQLEQADALAQEFNVIAIPSIVIGGKYKTDMSMVGGNPKKFKQVLDYLLAKAKETEAN